MVVSRATIRLEVIKKLLAITEHPNKITEGLKLEHDLDLGYAARAALAVPFTKISQRYEGKKLSQPKCRSCKTVKDAIDLVHGATK